jgi:hypothetical protein
MTQRQIINHKNNSLLALVYGTPFAPKEYNYKNRASQKFKFNQVYSK